MARIFEHQLIVTENEIDENGHVNNVEYVKWMQNIAVLHSEAQGFGMDEYRRLQATWVVRSHMIEYLSPAFRGDTIRAYTWVATIGRSQSMRKYKFVRTSDSKVLAKAETNWVYINTRAMRPCAIHDEVVKAFELVTDSEVQ